MFNYMGLADFASTLGSAGSSLIGGMFGLIGQKKQYKYNSKLQEQQAALEQQNWNQQFQVQNEYNSPSAQMQRLQEAGINPVFGSSGTIDTGVNGMSPAASIGAPSVGGAGSISPDFGQSIQNDLMRSFEHSPVQMNALSHSG